MIPGYLKTLRQANRTGAKSAEGSPLNALNALNAHARSKRPAPKKVVISECENPDFVEQSVTSFQTSTCAKSAKSPSRYRSEFNSLERRCPDLIEPDRWQQALSDGRQFLRIWGEQAKVLGWTVQELFGLHAIPAKPHPSFQRLARYNSTGLIWLLQGRPVVKMTADTAAIRAASGGIVVYRKSGKPAFGPLGDSLDDMGVT